MSMLKSARPCVPVLIAAAALIACGQPLQSKPDRTSVPAAAAAASNWAGVVEAPPLAEPAAAAASNWAGVVEAPPLAEPAAAAASNWAGVVEAPPLAEP